MKKILFAFIGMCLLCLNPAMAEVPREMSYQIMVLNPATGQVKSNAEVKIRMELRQGSQSGKSVWSQEFNATTNSSGICQLTLNFTDAIKWDDDKYYLASIIDGKECGAPQMTSVPYALKAASLEGIMTKSELIGTWKSTYSEKGTTYTKIYTFYENGTVKCTDISDYETTDISYNWYMNAAGNVALIPFESTAYGKMANVVKLSDTQMAFGVDDCEIYTKQ